MPHLTDTELLALGRASADAGECIVEASKRMNLPNAAQLIFEAGYFSENLERPKAPVHALVAFDGIGQTLQGGVENTHPISNRP